MVNLIFLISNHIL